MLGVVLAEEADTEDDHRHDASTEADVIDLSGESTTESPPVPSDDVAHPGQPEAVVIELPDRTARDD